MRDDERRLMEEIVHRGAMVLAGVLIALAVSIAILGVLCLIDPDMKKMQNIFSTGLLIGLFVGVFFKTVFEILADFEDGLRKIYRTFRGSDKTWRE